MEMHRLRPVVLAAGLISAWSAAAQDPGAGTAGTMNHFYVNGGAGVSIMRNVLSQGGVEQFDVGPRIVLSAGYDITPSIAVELQSGFAHNNWPTVSRVVMGGPGPVPVPVVIVGFSTDIWSVPVMVNGIYQHALNDHWQLFGGAGAGVLISTLHTVQPNFPGANIDSTDCEFGYQAMAGIKYHFNDHWETALGYNFLGSLDHHWSGNGTGLTTSPTYMHSILLSLTCKF